MKSEINTETAETVQTSGDQAVAPSTPCSASWVPYGRGKFALMLDPTKRVPTYAVALVKPARNEPGRYFWEHAPWMGQWGMADSLEDAKNLAGCPWKSLWQNDPVELPPDGGSESKSGAVGG